MINRYGLLQKKGGTTLRRPAMLLCFSICCLLMLNLGCGPSNPDGRVSVSGTVTWNGEPVKTGNILFLSTSKGKSSGGGIVEGEFKLPAHKGVPLGNYKVKITAGRPSGRKVRDSDYPDQFIDDIEQYIPSRYNDKTELTIDVEGTIEDLSYELTDK